MKNKAVAKRRETRCEKPQCYECKGFCYMRNECPNKEKEEANEKQKAKEKEKKKEKKKSK